MYLICLFLAFQLPPTQIVQVQPIPDAIQAEGLSPVTSGCTFLADLEPNQGQEPQQYAIRIAGLSAPEPAGHLATQLAQDSALALGSLIEWQFVELSCSRSEQIQEWNSSLRRYLPRTRLVCSVRLMWAAENDGFTHAKNGDIALEMLRRGRAWLRGFNLGDAWQDEVQGTDELAYYLAQSEARITGRGFWPYSGASWPFGARPERLPADRQMPTRRP